MPRALNGNLIVLEGQTCDFKYKIYCNIQQNVAKQFNLQAAKAFSEALPTSKQGGYLLEGNYFHKKIHLRF